MVIKKEEKEKELMMKMGQRKSDEMGIREEETREKGEEN